MCGIAGIMYKGTEGVFDTGEALIRMLDGCQHRGPDSTGFALYDKANPGELNYVFSSALPPTPKLQSTPSVSVCRYSRR